MLTDTYLNEIEARATGQRLGITLAGRQIMDGGKKHPPTGSHCPKRRRRIPNEQRA